MAVFDSNPLYHVKSATLSPTLDIASRLLHVVRMPLFFLIAGMVGGLLLARYSNLELIKQRAIRLLPPFAVGILLLTPWIKYFELADGRDINWRGLQAFDPSRMPDVLVFLRRYFTQFKWFSWAHMWFPLYLFILGTLLLPAQRWLMRRLWTPIDRWSAIVAFFIALLIVELTLRPYFPRHVPNLFWDWANVVGYIVVMMAGVALIRWPQLEAELQSHLLTFAVVAVAGAALFILAPVWPFKGLGRAALAWGFLCLLIGSGPYLSRGTFASEDYFSEAALPLYVLHHLPVVAIAFLVQDMPWPVGLRYVAIVGGGLTVALIAYHFLIVPFDPVRRAFGMRTRAEMQRAIIASRTA